MLQVVISVRIQKKTNSVLYFLGYKAPMIAKLLQEEGMSACSR